MVHRLACLCRYSETLALHYLLFGVGAVFEMLVMFPDVASSVGLAQFVPPAYLGYYTMAIAGLTIVARMRRFYQPDEDRDHVA